MTNVTNNIKLDINSTKTTEENDKFDIPLDILDIIEICKEYNTLGYQIQKQVEHILESGVEESIKNGVVKIESLPHIKDFLFKICENAWFGDASDQANDCIFLIENFEVKHPELFKSSKIN